MPEPKILRIGKEFHRLTQQDWLHTAQGVVFIEKTLVKHSGSKGRMDIFVDASPAGRFVAVAEIKNTNWDRMTAGALRRNITRQVRQVWEYVAPYVNAGTDVCPGVIFRTRPTRADRLELIENTFNENGIQVVWEDETIEQRIARS